MRFLVVLIFTFAAVNCLLLFGGGDRYGDGLGIVPDTGFGILPDAVDVIVNTAGNVVVGVGTTLTVTVGAIVGTASTEVVQIAGPVSGLIDLKTGSVVGNIVTAAGVLVESVVDFLLGLFGFLGYEDIVELHRMKVQADAEISILTSYLTSNLFFVHAIALQKEPAVREFLAEKISSLEEGTAYSVHYLTLRNYFHDVLSTCPTTTLEKNGYNKYLVANILEKVSLAECGRVFQKVLLNHKDFAKIRRAMAFLKRESTVNVINKIKSSQNYLAMRVYLKDKLKMDVVEMDSKLKTVLNIEPVVVFALYHIIPPTM